MKEKNICLTDEITKITIKSLKNNTINIFMVDNVPNIPTPLPIVNNEINIDFFDKKVINIYISPKKLKSIIIKETLTVNILVKTVINHGLDLISEKSSYLSLINTINNSFRLISNDLSMIEFKGTFNHLELLSGQGSAIFTPGKSKSKSINANACHSSKINIKNLKYKDLYKRFDFHAEVIS